MKTTIKSVLSLMITISLSANVFAQKTDKKTQTFTVTRIIKAPVEKVWAVVGEDYGAIAKSHPKIVSSNYVSGTLKSGEGAVRQCNLNEKGTKFIRETQINYDPGNYTFKAAINHVSGLPLSDDPAANYGIYKVERIDANTSKLVMDLSILTKPAFMGGLAKGKFKKTIADYLLAVEHHVTTGETVNKDNFKSIKKKYKS